MTKRFAVFALMMILLVCLPVWALAANLTIGDGETVTLSGTLSEGYDIQLDGQGTLVLDHVTMTVDAYAALEIDGTGSLNIIFKGNNLLTNHGYGIDGPSVAVTLTPGSADALFRIDNQSYDYGGILASRLVLAEGAKVDVNSPGNTAVHVADLQVGANAVLNAKGGWHGIGVINSTIGRNARVNAHGSFNGLWFYGLSYHRGYMIVEEGAEVNLSTDGAAAPSGTPLDIYSGDFQIKSGAKVNALTDVTYAAIVVDNGSIIVEEGAALNGVSNRSDGLGLMMNDTSSIHINSENVTFTGGTRGAITRWLFGSVGDPGTIHLGTQIIAQHRNAAAEPWEEMTGNITNKRYFRTAKKTGAGADEDANAAMPESGVSVPRTGDESNLILWSVLAAVSMFGMMTLVRRRKEA